MEDFINKIRFVHGVAKIENPYSRPTNNHRAEYIGAQMDKDLFEYISLNNEKLLSVGYRTIRDRNGFFIFLETDVIWVFDEDQTVKYVLKYIEVNRSSIIIYTSVVLSICFMFFLSFYC